MQHQSKQKLMVILLILSLVNVQITYQSIFRIKLIQPASSTKQSIKSINNNNNNPTIKSNLLNSSDHHTLTANHQDIFINPHHINLITQTPTPTLILQHHQIQHCSKLILFSITPSELDHSLIFQSDPTSHQQSNQVHQWWKDDLNQFISQLQEAEKSNHELFTVSSSSSRQFSFQSSSLLHEDRRRDDACESSRTHLSLRVNQTALVFVPPTSLKLFSEHLPAHMESKVHLYNPTNPSPTRSSNLETSNEKLTMSLSKISYKPKTDQLINTLTLRDFITDTKTLTGTYNTRSSSFSSHWITRQTFSEGSVLAAKWLKNQFEQLGVLCDFHEYQIGFSPNLICKILGSNPNERGAMQNDRIVLSAHYDSRGTFGILSAPGADDNAFGCAVLLSIARSIKRHQLSPKHDIYFVAFSGTEQGAWGSQALSLKWAQEGVSILLLLNANMIGYRVPGESMQLGLPVENEYSRLANWLIGNLTNLYLPELYIGQTPVRDLDSQSFGIHGVPATSLFERAGRIANPFFHTSSDLVMKPGYDLLQALTIGKAMYATVLELGF